MKIAPLVVALYAAFIMIGGIIGFVVAHSVASIVMSFTFALTLTVCSYYTWKGNLLAYDIATLLVFSLLLFFGFRFSTNFKWMPAGMMMLLSLSTFLYLTFSRKVFKYVGADRK